MFWSLPLMESISFSQLLTFSSVLYFNKRGVMVMFLALADKEDSRVTEGLNSEGKVF